MWEPEADPRMHESRRTTGSCGCGHCSDAYPLLVCATSVAAAGSEPIECCWGKVIMRVSRRYLLSLATLGIVGLGAFSFARPPIVAAKPAPTSQTTAGDPQLVDLAGYKDMV